jgi:hypothetical protein
MTYHLMHENKTGQKKTRNQNNYDYRALRRKGEGAWNNKYGKRRREAIETAYLLLCCWSAYFLS